ncbi:MAG: hypothetical protein R3F61_28950 [Myxococcota bacterium]
MLLLISAAMADCGLTELDSTMESIESAFAEMSEGFEPLRNRFHERIDCLSEPLNPKLAARVHRTNALFFFFDSDDGATRDSFARYRSLEPTGTLPDALAPSDHPLRQLFDGATARPKPEPLPAPATGWLLVDGEQETAAPRNLPFVFQHIADDGAVLSSSLVAAGSDPPAYDVAGVVVQPPEPDGPAPTRPPKKRLGPLTLAGIGVAGVGLVSYGAAFGTRGAYKNAVDAGEADRITSTHATTNGLTLGGLGLMAVGSGLVVAGVL